MTRKAFEQIVEEALAALPAEFQEHLENVLVLVEDRASCKQREAVGLKPNEDLFGLYEGVALTRRSVNEAGIPRPARIWVFQEPIESACSSRKEMIREIQDTVVHEIGHHFGLDEDEIGAIEDEYEYDDE
jgi:predicted Zn-dependent protease with MMP-like domain